MRHSIWLALILIGCSTDIDDPVDAPADLSADGEAGDDYVALDPARGKADGLRELGEPLEFAAACDSGDTLTIAAVGDVLLHGRLQKQAFADADGYTSLWIGIKDLLQDADVTYANLEGPTAEGVLTSGREGQDPGRRFDDRVYTSYPMFNYHPSLLDELMASGVDVVSTANNHSLDRRTLGADRTIDALEARGLPFTGTRRKGSDAPWYTFTDNAGFRLAWLACTYGTNGIPDNHHQVLGCYSDRERVVELVKELSARDDVDAVIVTPHWGSEYQAFPNRKEIDLGHELLDAGALAVIGSHPHVLQPWERHVTPDGRETFILYSLGNFVSGQTHLARRSTLLLYLSLVRGKDGVTRVAGTRYVPLHMTSANGRLTLEAIDRAGKNADSRALTVEMFGLWNLTLPATPVALTPQCEGGWEPAHPLDGWIGGQCQGSEVCGGATCDVTLGGGTCTEACDRFCPDSTGRAGTFCIDGADGSGQCVPKCDADTDCRGGFTCQPQARHGEPGVEAKVCTPSP